MKIGIIGAGISGLSIARLLNNHYSVEVLEKTNFPGGIARTQNINGVSYHVTGGHCFNSKHQEVLDFVFNKIMPLQDWNKIQRNAKIRFKGNSINYPIEFSIKEIATFNTELAIKMLRDLLQADKNFNIEHNNLEGWFINKFGKTLAEEYFIPYNKKIWNCDPKDMSPIWVEGKLPIPNIEAIFNSLFTNEQDKMPHSTFFYPKSNSQNTFIGNLARGINIIYNYDVKSIKRDPENYWHINNDKNYDILINTSPLNILPQKIDQCPDFIMDSASKLKYNKVTTMLWETKQTNSTWTYLPSPETIFHRYIHIGNFFRPQKNLTITEAVGGRNYEEMVENGKKDPFLIKPIAFNVSDHAYVVFNEKSQKNKDILLNYFNSIGIYNLGRFAEWEYYNMDICILQAIKLKNTILNLNLHEI